MANDAHDNAQTDRDALARWDGNPDHDTYGKPIAQAKPPTVHAHLRTPASGHVHDREDGTAVPASGVPYAPEFAAPEGERQHTHPSHGANLPDSGLVVRWDVIPEPTFRRFETLDDAVMERDERGRPTITVATGMTRARARELTALLNQAFRDGAKWRAVQEPRRMRSVYDGGPITCANCQVLGHGHGAEYGEDYAGDEFIEWPRSLDNFDYECTCCHKHIHPYTETGASR